MKIVINECYGGFSLSPQAVKRLAQYNGRKCYFFKNDSTNFNNYTRITLKEAGKRRMFWVAFDVSNTEIFAYPEDWHKLTDEEKQRHNDNYSSHNLPTRPDDRTDPLLIKVIEELGVEKASGSCAKLKIIEIPDNVEYEIEEYDGNEWIAEKHRTWR